jgi:hypothetical protein
MQNLEFIAETNWVQDIKVFFSPKFSPFGRVGGFHQLDSTALVRAGE